MGVQPSLLPKDKGQLGGHSRSCACPRPAGTQLGWRLGGGGEPGRFLVNPRRKQLRAAVPSSPGAGERLEVKVTGSGRPAPGRREVHLKSQPVSLEFLKERVGVK